MTVSSCHSFFHCHPPYQPERLQHLLLPHASSYQLGEKFTATDIMKTTSSLKQLTCAIVCMQIVNAKRPAMNVFTQRYPSTIGNFSSVPFLYSNRQKLTRDLTHVTLDLI